MADIVILGMEMPTNCGECAFLRRLEKPILYTSPFWCCINGLEVIKQEKNRYCPLVPMPKGHGRLVDADAFKADCLAATKEAKPDFIRHEDWLKSCAITMSFCRDIDERPTIVPAEGETDNGF